MTWFFILAYLVVQIFIGIWIARRIKSESDFLIAGRRLSLFKVSFSLFATWFGAETCIGSSAAVFAKGLYGSRADPFGFSICLLLMGLLLATKLRSKKYITLADHFRDRYGHSVERFAIWIMVPSSLFWAAAQLRAFGQIISFSSALPITISISLSVIFVIVYTYLGGLLGDIYTDLIQGVIIMIGLITTIILFVKATSDLGQILGSIDSSRWSFMGPQETLLERLDRWMVPILGSLTAQEALSRLMAAKSARIARNASFVACGIYLIMGSIPVFLGLVGPYLLHNLPDSEQFLITLAHGILPKAIFVVFSGALISTILSTIDSILIAISALISHNLIVTRFRLKSQRSQVLSARIIVVLAGLFAYFLAITSEGILSLVITASSFGTAGLLVITLMGFYSRIGGTRSANLALLGGLLAWPLSEYVFHLQAPYLVSILVALILFIWGAKGQVSAPLCGTAGH